MASQGAGTPPTGTEDAKEAVAHLTSRVERLTREVSRLRKCVTRDAHGAADASWLWRQERLDAIAEGVTPVPLATGPKVVLHVVPHSCFAQPAPFLDLKSASFLIFGTGGTATYNADGKLIWPENRGRAQRGYAQLSRTGWIEAVQVMRLHPDEPHESGAREPVYVVHIQQLLLAGVREYLASLERLGIAGPIEAAATLVGFDGIALRHNSLYDHMRLLISKSEIAFEPIRFPGPSVPPEAQATALRPILDSLWQAGGWERCPHFNDDGAYRDR